MLLEKINTFGKISIVWEKGERKETGTGSAVTDYHQRDS